MFEALADLLKRTMGLDAASIGPAAIERAARLRLAARGLETVEAYLGLVDASPDELQALVEAVVVPETWFFRDRESFTALAQVAGEAWRAEPAGRLRLLSLPCSTGEEPYSAAIALLEAGVPADRFRIDAVDISVRALAAARRGVFGRNSFRGADLEFRSRHFLPTAGGWQLAEAVRRQVEFRPGNLLDAGLPAGGEVYDVIFCRNLLIYFDRATQDRALAGLTRLLAPRGWLFVGPSETGLPLDHGYVSAKMALAFAFRPAGIAPPEPPVSRRTAVERPRAARMPMPAGKLPFSSVVARPAPVAAAPPAGLESAMSLADQGRLAEAVEACEAHLRAHGPSAQAFYVLGLARDAGDRAAEAAACYRKALYLDPQHPDALTHLALLLEGQGDWAGAKVMHDRARRLEPGARK